MVVVVLSLDVDAVVNDAGEDCGFCGATLSKRYTYNGAGCCFGGGCDVLLLILFLLLLSPVVLPPLFFVVLAIEATVVLLVGISVLVRMIPAAVVVVVVVSIVDIVSMVQSRRLVFHCSIDNNNTKTMTVHDSTRISRKPTRSRLLLLLFPRGLCLPRGRLLLRW